MIKPAFTMAESAQHCVLRSAVEAGLARLGDQTAYHKLDGNGEFEFTLTGNELRGLALSLADTLLQAATKPKRVAIVTPSGPEFLVALLACVYAGLECVAPPFPSPGPTRQRFGKIMADCRPDHLLCAASDMAAMQDRLEPLGMGHIAVLPITISGPTEKPNEIFDRLPINECGILQYTSGTSGSARAVVLTEANVVANVDLTVKSWNLSPSDSILTWLPHHHDMGLFGCLITPVLVGFPIHQMPSFTFLKRPSRWMEAMSRTRATLTGGPAFAMRFAIDAAKDVEQLDLSAARGIFCGSEPIAPDLLQNFADRFAPANLSSSAPFACYGLAESTLYVAGRPATSLTPACEVFDDGKHQVRIVDPETHNCVPEGNEGEVWITGPSIPAHYLNAPEESQSTFEGRLQGSGQPAIRWLRTGDIGVMRNGSLSVIGRIKDMIIANGANIPASEIEWTANGAVPGLEGLAAACFAFGPVDKGQCALIIEVERRAASDLKPEEAKRKVRAAVRAAHGVDLSDIVFVRRGAFPRTTSGKVQRRSVRDIYLNGELEEVVLGAQAVTV